MSQVQVYQKDGKISSKEQVKNYLQIRIETNENFTRPETNIIAQLQVKLDIIFLLELDLIDGA